MNSIKNLYGRLPVETRSRIRNFVPGQVRQWYAHKNTDVYLISYPKCGRTWLRLMIGRAISLHFSLPENEEFLFIKHRTSIYAGVPRIAVIHDDSPMVKTPEELETSKRKYKNKGVIFLVRDPRDVIVSSYFEMKNRGLMFGENPYEKRQPTFEGNMTQFITNRVGGFDTILRYYNIWAESRHIPKGFILTRYEDIKSDPQKELRDVLKFLDLEDISQETIEEAVDYAEFKNMQKMEKEGKFESSMLKPAELEDTESFKTRKGKVGGFVDYLSLEEIEVLNYKMRTDLSDYYGYNP